MERCIKYAYHRSVRHQFLARTADAEKVRRIVERSQVDTDSSRASDHQRRRSVPSARTFRRHVRH